MVVVNVHHLTFARLVVDDFVDNLVNLLAFAGGGGPVFFVASLSKQVELVVVFCGGGKYSSFFYVDRLTSVAYGYSNVFLFFLDFALELTDLLLQTPLVAAARHSFVLKVAQGFVDRHLVNVHRHKETCDPACLNRHHEQLEAGVGILLRRALLWRVLSKEGLI